MGVFFLNSYVNDTYKFLSLFSEDENEEFILTLFSDVDSIKNPKHLPVKLLNLNKPLNKWIAYKGKQKTFIQHHNLKKKQAVFFVVNAGGTKAEEINKKRAVFIDEDFAKEKYVYESEAEANKQREKLLKTGIFKRVEVEAPSAKNKQANQWIVRARKTKKEIKRLKIEFLREHKEELKDALIVETFSGFHIYWLINDCSDEMFKMIEEALIVKFNSDPQVKNLARILRVPGFYHQKYEDEEPFLVEVIQWSERRFDANVLAQELNLKLGKKQQEKGYTKEKVKERVSYKSELRRSTTVIKYRDKPKIEFAPPKPIEQEVTFSRALEEIKQRPLSDFVASPILMNGEKVECPFHEDEHPSAVVFKSEKGQELFYCHACEIETKNAITLYKSKLNYSYRKSVEKLARMIGLKIVRTEWEQDLKDSYDENREFLEEELDVLYPNLYYYISKYGRISYLRYFNDKASVKILDKDYSYEDKNIYFSSIRHIMKELGKTSMKSVHHTTCLLVLLGFLKRVPDESIPEPMKARSRALKESLKSELEEQGDKGKKRAEHLRDINFYITTNWSDNAFEMEKLARTLREKGFSMTKHMNKTGLTKLLGKELANRVFMDERVVSKKFEAKEAKLKEIIKNEIEEVGFCVWQSLLTKRIRYTAEAKEYNSDTKKVIKKRTMKEMTKKEKEDIFKRALPSLLGNEYQKISVRSEEKKKMFGYTKKTPAQIYVIVPV